MIKEGVPLTLVALVFEVFPLLASLVTFQRAKPGDGVCVCVCVCVFYNSLLGPLHLPGEAWGDIKRRLPAEALKADSKIPEPYLCPKCLPISLYLRLSTGWRLGTQGLLAFPLYLRNSLAVCTTFQGLYSG